MRNLCCVDLLHSSVLLKWVFRRLKEIWSVWRWICIFVYMSDIIVTYAARNLEVSNCS